MTYYAIPPRRSSEWDYLRDKLLMVPKPEVDHPNNWLEYFDRLRDVMEEELEP